MKRGGLVAWAAAIAGLAGAGWWAYDALYATPAATLRDELDTLRGRQRSYERALEAAKEIDEDLRAIAGRAVGGDRESLEHRLRAAMLELGRRSGLSRIEVDSLQPEAIINPAAGSRISERPFRRALERQVDASRAVVRLDGVGTLESCLTALAMAQGQPWAIGVDSWSVRPAVRSRGGERGEAVPFELSLSATVLVMDAPEAIAGEIPISPLADAQADRVRAFVAADPFGTAPAPEPVSAPPAPPPPPPPPASPPPPGAGWTLAGVLEGRSGQYAIVVHDDGNRRTLSVGQEVGGVRFDGGDGETAVFVVGTDRYEVRNGQSLAYDTSRER